jgi:hypothetical protein
VDPGKSYMDIDCADAFHSGLEGKNESDVIAHRLSTSSLMLGTGFMEEDKKGYKPLECSLQEQIT